MLKILDLHAYYGKSHILRGVNLDIAKGEIIALLGRNGVGRSTLVKSVMGLVPIKGSINYKDKEIDLQLNLSSTLPTFNYSWEEYNV